MNLKIMSKKVLALALSVVLAFGSFAVSATEMLDGAKFTTASYGDTNQGDTNQGDTNQGDTNQGSSDQEPVNPPAPTVVEVTGIKLSATSLALEPGKTATLKATVTPTNATNKAVTWSTSNAKVATVSNGTVKAVGNGTATITATTANGKKATCNVSVTTSVTQIKLNKKSEVITKGEKFTLKATVTPATASNKKVTWTTSDKKVATVDKNGKVTGKGAGTAVITAKTANGKTATCTITVATVTLNAKQLPVQVGKSTTALTYTKSYSKDKVASWKSSNTKVATVNKNGKITGKKAGSAKITLTMKSGATATCTVKVQKNAVVTKSLKFESKNVSLVPKTSTTLTVIRNPISATEKITYTTSDKKIATVNNKGKVTAKKPGTVTITAKSANGKKATCKVTVKEASVKLSKAKGTVKVGKTVAIKIKSSFPENDTVKSYKSSNAKIASVSKDGVVTGKKAGTATITVTMKSGAKATYKVTVKK